VCVFTARTVVSVRVGRAESREREVNRNKKKHYEQLLARRAHIKNIHRS